MAYYDLCRDCYRTFTDDEKAQELERLKDELSGWTDKINDKLDEYEKLQEYLKNLLDNLDHNLSEIRSLPVEIQPPLYPLRNDLNRARNEVYSALCQCEKYIKKLKGVLTW